VIGYLAGEESLREDCSLIIDQANAGELEIVVSMITQSEVAYLRGLSAEDSEARITEFFNRDYVVSVAVDAPIARLTRRLMRQFNLKAPDAIHVATGELLHIPIIETTDPDLLKLDGQTGNPRINIRRPLYEGPRRLLT
jgi:predicted nucleic acid-binding protein